MNIQETIHAVQEQTNLSQKEFPIYAVGGAVRDYIRGNRTFKDIDLVVIGDEALKTYLLSIGWEQTGKSFPVFRHKQFPDVELAIGRGEKKTGTGHNGFEWHYASSLREDLYRRDFTMNAIAMKENGFFEEYLIGGYVDIQNKIIRHIGPAFSEDPLRVFRAARFASQLNFSIANETLTEMFKCREELKSLSFERVREEMMKALITGKPDLFFDKLFLANVLDVWFPELFQMSFIPAGPLKHHPEGDCYTHSIYALQFAVNKGYNLETRLFALTHDFGKLRTPKELWPKHKKHEDHTKDLEVFCKRFGFSKKETKRMVTHARYHMKCHSITEIAHPGKLVKYWKAVKGFREEHLNACYSDINGRGMDEHDYPEKDYLAKIFNHLDSVKIDPEVDFTLERVNNRFNHAAKHIMNKLKIDYVTIMEQQ